MFKFVNGAMALFCAVTMWANHVGVNVLDAEKAVSSYSGNVFEYTSTENSFSAHKNGELIGKIPTNQKMNFNSYGCEPFLRCNAVIIAGKTIITYMSLPKPDNMTALHTFFAVAGAATTGIILATAFTPIFLLTGHGKLLA